VGKAGRELVKGLSDQRRDAGGSGWPRDRRGRAASDIIPGSLEGSLDTVKQRPLPSADLG
jgi:hypothetical protein